jgi:hypothetical protein
VGNIKLELKEVKLLGLVSCASGCGPVFGCCEYGNELSGSLKWGGGGFVGNN